MNTDSRRKASAAYHAKRQAEGLKKVTLWLSPEARFKLDALKAVAGSKDKAADAAILAWAGPKADSPAPAKPGKRAVFVTDVRDTGLIQVGPHRAKPGERQKKR